MFLLTLPIFIMIISFIYNWIYRTAKKIEGKHVLIIGGSSGIGKALASSVAKRGAHVTIMARNVKKLEEALELLKKCKTREDQRIKYVSLDVSDYKAVNQTLLEVDKELPVYMLVNCAGLAICGKLEDISIDDVRKLFDVNYYGTHHAIKTLVPRMKSRQEGCIVITGSQASLLGIYGLSAYSATKFALRGLAESLSMELQPYNIHVTLALPPDTDTPGFEEENKSKPEETKLISGSAGIFKPEEVAVAILDDVLNENFFSYIGIESFMVTTLCVGMTPHGTLFRLLYQSLLLGPVKCLSAFYLWSFHNIIKDCAKKVKKD